MLPCTTSLRIPGNQQNKTGLRVHQRPHWSWQVPPTKPLHYAGSHDELLVCRKRSGSQNANGADDHQLDQKLKPFCN